MSEPSPAGPIGLLYISTSNLRLPDEAAHEVDSIVNWSRRRNQAIGVTGALVFTERRFAQYLEGPACGVDELMASISRDARHRDIDLIFRKPIDRPRFETWALAYAGPSTFVAGHVLAAADASGAGSRAKQADRLVETMSQFVQAQVMEQRRRSGG
ncbi:MAG TPA: BLUF domain-containing protein [Allosphingosinicella sp.]